MTNTPVSIDDRKEWGVAVELADPNEVVGGERGAIWGLGCISGI